MLKIISVVGARPNFMKVAPLHKAFEKLSEESGKWKSAEGGESKKEEEKNSSIAHQPLTINHLICHTGQHYDEKMSKVFFDELELPKPDFYLGVGSGSHAEQTAKVMIEFEKILLQEKPDLVIVVGDVNSTIACSLAAVKLHIKVAHVEAGLRSFDKEMPEEINRVLTDTISDFLFITEKSGLENLKNSGISDEKVFFVGNCMIDSLIHYLPKVDKSTILETYCLLPTAYLLVTLHRPSNVDEAKSLREVIEMLNHLSEKRKIVFPIHPRTRANIKAFGLESFLNENIILTDPIGYLDFISLVKNCELVITDSGGIQEESTYLGVQCLTLRDNTERPVTVEVGTNHLVGTDFKKAELAAVEILSGKKKIGKIPELWDGKAAERIVRILVEKLNC
ncbi:MAG: UDP-N-acetylglucosamine 2-epimerase (non-hydrolyzing) [Melioribacteraceae bacterium]